MESSVVNKQLMKYPNENTSPNYPPIIYSSIVVCGVHPSMKCLLVGAHNSFFGLEKSWSEFCILRKMWGFFVN